MTEYKNLVKARKLSRIMQDKIERYCNITYGDIVELNQAWENSVKEILKDVEDDGK